MKTVTTHQAKTHLSRLLKDVQAGEVIVILSSSVPVAKLIAVDNQPRVRPAVGTVTSGDVSYEEDAFQPLTDEELKSWGI